MYDSATGYYLLIAILFGLVDYTYEPSHVSAKADLVDDSAQSDGLVEPTGSPNEESLSDISDNKDDDIEDYWQAQLARWFITADVSIGVLNRVRGSAGYGKPYWLWGGIDLQAATTTEFGTLSAGLRGDLLLVNAMIAVRSTWSYERRQPRPEAFYDDDALSDTTQPRNTYSSLDAWMWGYIPIEPTLGYWELCATWLPTMPDDAAIFEEYHRYTSDRDVVVMIRGAWWYELLKKRIWLGPAGDVVGSEGRKVLVRVGGSVNIQLTVHTTVQLLLTVPIFYPDDINWFTQSWGIARLNWQWASDEPEPGW